MIVDHAGVPATRIDDRHYQSGFPYPFRQVAEAGFDLVVLCAEEAQPKEEDLAHVRKEFPRLGLVLCPFDDTEDALMLPYIAKVVRGVAGRVAQRLDEGRRVLVTCAAGRNRSGLVSALVLMRRRGLSGRQAADRVRSVRPLALTNQSFRTYLESLPAGDMR